MIGACSLLTFRDNFYMYTHLEVNVSFNDYSMNRALNKPAYQSTTVIYEPPYLAVGTLKVFSLRAA